MEAVVKNPEDIKLGIIGMTEGNGHPYSWSAIINGYDKDKMVKKCPYSLIPAYLNREPDENYDINCANITHIFCDNKKDAENVAECTMIPNVVDSPEEMTGNIDAVIIATDLPHEHVERTRPFIEAGIPVLIDKPLCNNFQDLNTFRKWVKEKKHPLMSASSLRYRKEFIPYQISTNEFGKLRFVSMTMSKYWTTYGIHALEAIYTILGTGFESIQNLGDSDARNIVHLTHKSGTDIIIACIKDIPYAGYLRLVGTENHACIGGDDFFFSFKALLWDFIRFLQTGKTPYPFSETEELIKLLIGGTISREANNRKVYMKELNCE